MRICLIGEFFGYLDEGMRKTSYYLSKELSKSHQVLNLDIRDYLRMDFWRNLKSFSPDIIHYVHGPTIKSLALMKIISKYYNKASTVISVLHPKFTFLSIQLLPLLKPNLQLVQSQKTEEILYNRGCKTLFLPSGVDTNLFKPVGLDERNILRDKFGIAQDKYVILHVGSIKEERNVQLFKKLQIDNNQVVIVGSTSTGIDDNIAKYLDDIGCMVFQNYIDNIEEMFGLSDCYVFPTKKEFASIETPLTVLEAMACNLPVISTKFGALPRIFSAGEGLLFLEDEKDILSLLKNIKEFNGNVKTRSKIQTYSWENIAIELENIYLELIRSRYK